jgi:hypothetical protein
MKKFLAGGLSAALASLTLASAAVATPPHHPTGEFTQFANCPLSRATLTDCLYHVIDGGSVTIGKRTVPIKNPITIQGGFEGAGSEISYFGAEDGNTLSKVPQPVPGGLLGLNPPSWWPKAAKEKFNNIVDKGITGVTATVELAGPATAIKLNTENYIFQEGTAIEMPVKVKLDNRLLRNNCYIGSNADPMVLKLGTGITAPPAPNQPIQGTPGVLSFNESFTLTTVADGRLVDNAFAVPKARGCGGVLSPFIDPLVNSTLGTPSPAGRNTAILEGTLQTAAASAVRASES